MGWKDLLWGGGRTGRRSYWTILAASVLVGWVGHAGGATVVASTPDAVAFAALGVLAVELLTAWIVICLCARRLHDIGRSAWWQLLPIALSFVAYALAEPAWTSGFLSEAQSIAFAAAGLLIYLAFLLMLGSLKSQAVT